MYINYFFKSTKGMSIVELIVSISIIAIITAPFLGTILTATRNNTLSENVIKANNLAMKVMDEMKSQPGFLMEEALSLYEENDSYKEYITVDRYKVKYRITKELGTYSPLSDTYDQEETIPYNVNILIGAGRVTVEEEVFLLDIYPQNTYFGFKLVESDGRTDYEFYDQYDVLLKSGLVNVPDISQPINIKIQYVDTDESFSLNVNIDGISSSREVNFFIIDNNGGLELENVGQKTFVQHDRMTSHSEDYFNTLYKIEVLVEEDGEKVCNLFSTIKK